MFNRSAKNAGAAEPPAATSERGPSPQAVAAPKGRATPKRSTAQAARKTAAIGHGTRTRGGGASRGPMSPRERREALRRGDESALPARDRGPVRRFARDYVDARLNVVGFFVPIAVLTLGLGFFVRATSAKQGASVLLYAFFLAALVDTMLVGRAIRRHAAARFPDESTRGVALYAATRGMQFRRMRLPEPRVSRGDKV